MRLLVVTQYFWPENFRINDLVAELVRKGHTVTVLTGKPNYPDGRVFDAFAKSPQAFDSYEGASVVRIPMFARGRGGLRLVLNYLSYAISASLMGAWRLRGQAFDSILVYEPSPITVGIPGVVLRALKRAPMALWVLDLWPETLKAVGVLKSDRALRLIGFFVGWIYRRCDLILAQSKSFIPQIRHYAGNTRRVEYFPSWAEALFDGGSVVPAPELPVHQSLFTIMFAGNIGEAQDFPAILAAVELLRDHKDIRWVVLGDGRMAAWLAQEITARGLADAIQCLGRYPVERMPSFFQHADALLVSLKKEPIFAMTIPGKLQSYLAAGIPVLAMLDGEGSELLVKAEAGMTCAAGDSAGLARAVLELKAMTSAERKAMGARGTALYEREFQRQTLVDKAEALLLSMAKMP
jgi:colanic acid biosynthesis glycosyl transferase WcaI